MPNDEVERLFNLCDTGGKGYLTEKDLQLICPQLKDDDIAYIFAQLDIDGSGKIDRDEFCAGFEEVVMNGERQGHKGMQRRASVLNSVHERRANEELFDSEAEVSRPSRLLQVDDDYGQHSESDASVNVDFNLPCQEEVVILYQQLQSAGMPQLLRKFEKVVGSFYKEMKGVKHENERLQHVYESEREMYNRRMEEVENELDQQLIAAEMKAREQERSRLTKEKEEMKLKLEDEMHEMRKNIERLQKMETILEKEGEKLSQQKQLSEKLKEVCSENNELRRGMAENHLELAMIKSEMAHVRADYEMKKGELDRKEDELIAIIDERESSQKQLQLLFDANRKLHETNDNLREALDSRAAVFRQFNIATPSPSPARPSSAAALTPLTSISSTRRTPSPFSPIYDDDTDSGMTLNFDDSLSESGRTKAREEENDDKPTTTLESTSGTAERTFRVVMCGDAAVGKSSLVLRVIKGQFTGSLPSTLGVDFHVKTIRIDGRNVALQLWDTAGQERFRSLCKSYFRRADGAILVYDVTSERSFLRVRDWIETIKESVERNIPVILVGNKTDLRLSSKDGVPHSDGAAMAAAMGVLFAETSARDGSNVDSALLTLTREMMACEDVEVRASGVVLSPKDTKKTGCFSKCRS